LVLLEIVLMLVIKKIYNAAKKSLSRVVMVLPPRIELGARPYQGRVLPLYYGSMVSWRHQDWVYSKPSERSVASDLSFKVISLLTLIVRIMS
jgi:hypothetical protein